jgi:hypothetical protein
MNGQQHNSSNHSEAVLRLSNGYRKIRDYGRSVSIPNRMYLTGLFSKISLLVSQIGQGGGFAMKVHPAIGYHFLIMPIGFVYYLYSPAFYRFCY